MTKNSEVKPGYRETDLGLIPNTWSRYSLSELFDFRNGVNAGKEAYGNGIKFINILDVLNNSQLTADKIEGVVTINESQISSNLVFYGDILFNRTSETPGEIGLTTVYMDTEPVVFGGFVIRGRQKNKNIDDNFKVYCFSPSYMRKQIIANGQGAIRANIGQGDLEKVSILLPPIPEQKAIAKVLSAWDKAIEQIQELITQKELRKKALMQQLLTGKKRLPGFNSKGNHQILGNMIKEVSVRNSKISFNRVLSVTNSKGFINQSEQFDRSVASEDLSNYKIVMKGQFAYNPSRVNVGSIDMLTTYENGVLSPMYIVFETLTEKVLPEYLYFQLKSYWFIGHIPMFVQGSVRDSLSFDSLCGIKFFLPNLSEQVAITDIFLKVDQEISILRKKLRAIKEQKKGLLQVLLTGKKRIKL